MNSLQKISLIILSIGIFSCGSETETIVDNKNEIPVEDSVIIERVPATITSLNGLVYEFAPEFDENTCESFFEGDCDGCTTLFLNDSEFVDISYCGMNKYVSSGTYLIEATSVKFNYSGISVSQEHDVDDNPILAAEKGSPSTSIFSAFLCNEQIILEIDSEVSYFGHVNNETTVEEEIEWLKEEKIWEKLK